MVHLPWDKLPCCLKPINERDPNCQCGNYLCPSITEPPKEKLKYPYTKEMCTDEMYTSVWENKDEDKKQTDEKDENIPK